MAVEMEKVRCEDIVQATVDIEAYGQPLNEIELWVKQKDGSWEHASVLIPKEIAAKLIGNLYDMAIVAAKGREVKP